MVFCSLINASYPRPFVPLSSVAEALLALIPPTHLGPRQTCRPTDIYVTGFYPQKVIQLLVGARNMTVDFKYVTGFEKRDLIAQIMILRYRRFKCYHT